MIARAFIFIITYWIFGSVLCAAPVVKQTNNGGVIEFSNASQLNKKTQKTLIYKTNNSNVPSFTDQKPTHADYEVLRFDCFACNPDSTINWYQVKLNRTAFDKIVKSAAKKNKVDPALVRALIHAESAFKPKVKSPMGAIGLMQLMPATARELGVGDASNPQQNINGGVKYLAQLIKQFNGDLRLATAAYNAGPNAVKKYKGIPPYRETEVYVKRVMILHQRYKQAG
ncbi:lytic transglycosylase domain-containing protein [Pseudomonadota bacterium]|nr:lytic transglycosylase domain-containing protein [Pseudomonadota bacterium]